jgi:hypothetical protein
MTGNPRPNTLDDLPRAARHDRVQPSSSEDRLAQIRERIREGAYDSAAVLEAVAHRILRSRDI